MDDIKKKAITKIDWGNRFVKLAHLNLIIKDERCFKKRMCEKIFMEQQGVYSPLCLVKSIKQDWEIFRKFWDIFGNLWMSAIFENPGTSKIKSMPFDLEKSWQEQASNFRTLQM